MQYVYAIGDVHGRDHLLERLHERISLDPQRPPDADRALVVHLGDYIDGGPRSDLVIDRLMRGSAQFDSICLLGNHEELMLECLSTDDRDVWWNWISNGGDKTLNAFGVSLRAGYDCRELREALGESRIKWLRALPLHHASGVYLFVHAGIAPGVALALQQKKDMLWIRSRFLNSEEDHGYIVVHGHTQTVVPEVRHNRIGIDTGEARPKTLTAVALSGLDPPRFIQVSE